MYCQQCGSKNIQEARFCRKCGSRVAATSESLPEYGEQTVNNSPYLPSRQSQFSTTCAVKKISSGLAFLAIAIAFAVVRMRWGLWMLFPAFVFLGKGISMMTAIRLSGPRRVGTIPPDRTHADQGQEYYSGNTARLRTGKLGPETSEIAMPPSVTEGTTRIMGPSPERHPEQYHESAEQLH